MPVSRPTPEHWSPEYEAAVVNTKMINSNNTAMKVNYEILFAIETVASHKRACHGVLIYKHNTNYFVLTVKIKFHLVSKWDQLLLHNIPF